MSTEKKTLTQIAFDVINDEELLLQKVSTAEEVLAYLKDEEHFKTLSQILKETMIKAKIYTKEQPTSDFSKELYRRLKNQDNECSNPGIPSESTVDYWFSGKTKSIRYRYTAIQICFALNLNIELSREFLNKCGYNSFNSRVADDAIYLYCILKGLPFSTALTMINTYKACPEEVSGKSEIVVSDNENNMTLLLETLLKDTNWDNEDDFLAFMIANKHHFTGYSLTALNEYFKWKNFLWFTVISDSISNELVSLKYRFSVGQEDLDHLKDFFPTLCDLKSALTKCNKKESALYEAYSMYNKDEIDVDGILVQIKKIIEAPTDIESKKEISEFLSDIIKPEGLLKRTFVCLLSKKDRLRRRSASSLSKTVLDEFPYADTFSAYENDPSFINEHLSVRKAIILMYYISYAYEFSFPADNEYSLNLFGRLGFLDFYEDLNITLLDCHLPPLYPANQFDWLILRSIREFEVSIYAEDKGDPIGFFNDVLGYSFGDNPETDY